MEFVEHWGQHESGAHLDRKLVPVA